MALPLGTKLSFFAPGSEYHGGPGGGRGVRQFKSGQHFDGGWQDDEQQGHGVLTTQEGTAYDGEWDAGQFHGHGRYQWQSGTVYEGQWSRGVKEGAGKLTQYNGNEQTGFTLVSTYEGQFRADERHGSGLYKVVKPTIGGLAVYEGEWAAGRREGVGTQRGTDGHVEISRYKNDLPVGEGARWLDPSLLKPGDFQGPVRLADGKEVEDIDESAAAAIAKALGVAAPTFPFHP